MIGNMSLGEEYLRLKRRLFDKYYSFLNKEQKEAVYTTEGAVLILAGAGSGKTTVLVNRIVFIVKYGNAYFSQYIPYDINLDTIETLKKLYSLEGEELGAALKQFRPLRVSLGKCLLLRLPIRLQKKLKKDLPRHWEVRMPQKIFGRELFTLYV